MNIISPTAAAACLHLRVSSPEASPPAASALYLPVLGVVTTDFVSHQTPAAVSNTKKDGMAEQIRIGNSYAFEDLNQVVNAETTKYLNRTSTSIKGIFVLHI
jgi:hypothetical protein